MANTTPQTYADWFAERNIQIGAYSQSDFEKLWVQMTRDATGMSLNTKKSLKDLQAAMIGIMGGLSSYSVQFLTEINSSDIKTTDWVTVRPGDVDVGFNDTLSYDLQMVDVGVLSGQLKPTVTIDPEDFAVLRPEIKLMERIVVNCTPVIEPDGYQPVLRVNFNIGNTRFKPAIPALTNARGMIPVMGLDTVLALTIDQQRSIPDLYGSQASYVDSGRIDPSQVPPPVIPIPDPNDPVGQPPVDLDQAIQDRTLPGFDHT